MINNFLVLSVLSLLLASCSSFSVNQSSSGNQLGFLGCSMTQDKGKALRLYGEIFTEGIDYWNKSDLNRYLGAGLCQWGDDPSDGTECSKYTSKWKQFKKNTDKYPNTTHLIVELCGEDDYTEVWDDKLYDWGNHIYDRIPEFVDTSEVEIFVMGQHPYVPPHVCQIAGANGPAFMQQVADSLVNKGYQDGSNIFAPLDIYQLNSDGCHMNEAAGMDSTAAQLERWMIEEGF